MGIFGKVTFFLFLFCLVDRVDYIEMKINKTRLDT